MSDPVQEKISQTVKENPILIFMKGTPVFPQCGFSAAVIEIFNSLGAKYQTVNVLDDPDVRDGIKQFSNCPTIPQIYIQGKFIGGCDIVREMHARGELKSLVQAVSKA